MVWTHSVPGGTSWVQTIPRYSKITTRKMNEENNNFSCLKNLVCGNMKQNEEKVIFSHFFTFSYLLRKNMFFQVFANFSKTNPQNALYMIWFIWQQKNFEIKILVPWDTIRVPGVWISGGPTPRILKTANSCYLGSVQLPCTSGLWDSSRKSKND